MTGSYTHPVTGKKIVSRKYDSDTLALTVELYESKVDWDVIVEKTSVNRKVALRWMKKLGLSRSKYKGSYTHPITEKTINSLSYTAEQICKVVELYEEGHDWDTIEERSGVSKRTGHDWVGNLDIIDWIKCTYTHPITDKSVNSSEYEWGAIHKVVTLYETRKGWAEISQKTGISKPTAQSWLENLGILRDGVDAQRAQKTRYHGRAYDDLEEECRRLWLEGITQTEIMEMLDLQNNTVRRFLERRGLLDGHARKTHEARKAEREEEQREKQYGRAKVNKVCPTFTREEQEDINGVTEAVIHKFINNRMYLNQHRNEMISHAREVVASRLWKYDPEKSSLRLYCHVTARSSISDYFTKLSGGTTGITREMPFSEEGDNIILETVPHPDASTDEPIIEEETKKEKMVRHRMLEEAMKTLNDQDYTLVREIGIRGRKLSDMAQDLDCSDVWAGKLYKQALGNLRHHFSG